MALNQFPYTNFHELNGDYVLQTVQQSAADAQAAQQSAQAAQQAAQTAAGQVTEANVKAAAALIAANEAKSDAKAADTKAEQALAKVQTATDSATAAAASAQTAQAQATAAQQAAGNAQTSAAAADQSAQQAASDAERAITLANQALGAIPTADTMAWDPVPNNAYYIGTTPGYVGTALDIAYPKYIEFTRVGSTNNFQASPATPIEAIIPALLRGLRLGAIISESGITEIFTLSDMRISSNTIHLAWISAISAGGDSSLNVLVLECPRNATTLTAGLHSYDLTRLEV